MSALPNGPSFSHMGIYVRDVARMEDFYKRVMGFTVTDRGNLDTPRGPVYLVFLSRDPEEHHQVVLASGRPDGEVYNIVNQMSFRVPDLAWLRTLH
ncbi:MAG: VOC family protein, partial [Betaproteobacteria bacterium]